MSDNLTHSDIFDKMQKMANEIGPKVHVIIDTCQVIHGNKEDPCDCEDRASTLVYNALSELYDMIVETNMVDGKLERKLRV